MLKFTILGEPRTKKNSGRIIMAGGRPRLIPSKYYVEYEQSFITQCMINYMKGKCLSQRLNIACVYYMKTHRKVDLTNLLSATMDCLVSANVIEDDNCNIACSHDGSYVDYDKEKPRVEITITDK